MTDNDSFLGPQKPPTPSLSDREVRDHHDVPWILPTVGYAMGPEDEQVDTTSRLCIMGEIRSALEGRSHPQLRVNRSLNNVMDAYGFVAREMVRISYAKGDPLTFDQLMALEPWVKAGHSSEILPSELILRLQKGLPLVKGGRCGLDSLDKEELDRLKHQYAEIIAWAQAGRDEILSQEERIRTAAIIQANKETQP